MSPRGGCAPPARTHRLQLSIPNPGHLTTLCDGSQGRVIALGPAVISQQACRDYPYPYVTGAIPWPVDLFHFDQCVTRAALLLCT